jgi:hypothetical protein
MQSNNNVKQAYAQEPQFREVLFRMAPNWVRSFPEGKLAIQLLSRACADGATWFLTTECERFVLLCENLGINPESVIKVYRLGSRKYRDSAEMRYA